MLHVRPLTGHGAERAHIESDSLQSRSRNIAGSQDSVLCEDPRASDAVGLDAAELGLNTVVCKYPRSVTSPSDKDEASSRQHHERL